MMQLQSIVKQLEARNCDIHCLLLESDTESKTFCSGMAFDMFEVLDSSFRAFEMSSLMTSTLTRLRKLPCISVSVMHGPAVGGGAELCTATDFRLLHDTAHISFVHSRMGLSPGWGGAHRLAALVGPTQALRLLATSHKISPSEALHMRLIDGLLYAEAPPKEQAEAFLAPFLTSSLIQLHQMKSLLLNVGSGIDDNKRSELATIETLAFAVDRWRSAEHLAAMAAVTKGKHGSSRDNTK